jgi:putative ABC transport system substrate-binding protein
MRRRDFITLLGGAMAGWPLAARAQQQPAVPMIGYLNSDFDGFAQRLSAFRQGLKDAGFVEGQNLTIEYRTAAGQVGRLPGLAAELVQRRVALIVTSGIPATQAAKEATTTIPIVFSMGGDPVEFGIVPNLNRPGGNMTGVSNLSVELASKRLELLHEMVPAAKLIGALVNPTNVNAKAVSLDLQAAAGLLGLQINMLHSTTKDELNAAFAAVGRLGAGALVISNSGPFINNSELLGKLALDNRMPTIFQYREFAAAGGLASYGGSNGGEYNVLGSYVGRILRGEKPGDLPIQLNSKVELIINLKTAKALGLTVPETLLARADEVIE